MDVVAAKVLVVDDCKHVRGFLETVLKNKGVDVTCVASGVDAINLCKSTKYDLVFMDMRMPEMSGPETMRAIRKFDHTTPALALTADDRTVFAADDESLFDEYLSKPINSKYLLELVQKYKSQAPVKKQPVTFTT